MLCHLYGRAESLYGKSRSRRRRGRSSCPLLICLGGEAVRDLYWRVQHLPVVPAGSLAMILWQPSRQQRALSGSVRVVVAGAAKDLDRKYQAMERDRKSYTDESQNVIRKQRCAQAASSRWPFADVARLQTGLLSGGCLWPGLPAAHSLVATRSSARRLAIPSTKTCCARPCDAGPPWIS